MTWDRKLGRWKAQVHHNYRNYYVGLFDTIDEAASAARAKRLELFTHSDMDHAAIIGLEERGE